MAEVSEAVNAKTPLGSALAAGVDVLSMVQELVFTQYTRVILPIDGYWFWVKSEAVSPSALYNAAMFNAAAYNGGPIVTTPAPTLIAKGSLHFESAKQQNEDETLAVNRVVFTSETEILDLNKVGPNTIYISTIGTPENNTRFAFSTRQMFYRQANLYHYVGTALYPSMASQVIDDPALFNSMQPVVSNSLPTWLSLNSVSPLPWAPLSMPCPLYPSFAVPSNLEPPYGVVHIFPEGTEALQGAPYIDQNFSHWQLAQDKVRITLYGLRNADALVFQDLVNQYSLNTDSFGFMDMPIMRDEKKTQVELNILAMKKTYSCTVSYYQNTMRRLARQLITSAIPSYIVEAA